MSNKNGLLDHLYEFMSEDDWLDGLDLYKSGKLKKFEQHGHLLLGKCLDPMSSRVYEVRCKIHPTANIVQWYECTCKTNRIDGLYCSHIVSLTLHMKDHLSKLFQKISNIAPARPPAKAMRRISKKLSEAPKKDSAAVSMIEHLRSSFQKIELADDFGSINIHVTASGKKNPVYQLDCNQAANFLSKPFDKKLASDEILKLKVFDTPLNTFALCQEESVDEISVSKVIGLKVKRKWATTKLESVKTEYIQDRFVQLPDKLKETFLLFFIDKIKLDEYSKYVFIKGLGYFPVHTNTVTQSWWDSKPKNVIAGDNAANLINSSFKSLLEYGDLLLSKDLSEVDTKQLDQIQKISIKKQKGWFDLDPRYKQGKTGISLVDILKKYKEKKQKYFRSGKSWIEVPEIITSYDWQFDPSGKFLRVNPIDLIRFQASIGTFDNVSGAKEALKLLSNVENQKITSEAPKLTNTNLNLRKYQYDGYLWLWWLYENRLHGLLADDMGLGKTHQTMAILSGIQNNQKEGNTKSASPCFLIICPTTVMMHWEEKVNEFAPQLNVEVYHGTKRQGVLNRLQKSTHTIITSYGILLRDIKQLSEFEWDVVTLDEAHFVKNNTTSTYQAVLQLKSDFRLCLTGTPMENRLYELKNIFDFLLPGYLGSNRFFKKQFGDYENFTKDPEKEILLQKLIHPFKLRRTKEQVLDDLPSKQEDTIHSVLSEEQAGLYRSILEMKGQPLIEALQDEGAKVSYMHVFTTLQLLKQICDHPALLKNPLDYQNYSSGKFDLLKELLSEAIDSNNKIVIFSQYIEMINIISHYLGIQDIKHVVLTGSTRNRAEVINKFQTDDSIKVFIGSLMAGGIGIDLTAASVVIHYDRWWNASKENQATDRVHRIGQKKFVQVYKLVTKGTLEEKIDSLISKKQSMFSKFLEKDEDVFKGMSRQDMLDMLQHS